MTGDRVNSQNDPMMMGPEGQSIHSSPAARAVEPPPTVLLVTPDGSNARTWECLVVELGGLVDHAETLTEARELEGQERYDLVVIDFEQGDGKPLDMIRRVSRDPRQVSQVIVVGSSPSGATVVEAMRAGACDFVPLPLDPDECRSRLEQAFVTIGEARRRDDKIQRLKRVCRRLNSARLDVTNQVDSLCNDLVLAYQELTDQIGHVTTITEFSAIVRQELEVEDLLRTTLEYLLRKIGPMNAAVYLPGAGDDFTLGAYVNYDIPKETSDFLLDHFADVFTPKLIEDDRLFEFTDADALQQWLGADATWLQDSHVITFGCCSEDECLAVFVLFRDLSTPFASDTAALLDVLREVFATQLAHVIHVHHRHLPDGEWPGWGSDEMEDDDDPFGFGDSGGGMAA